MKRSRRLGVAVAAVAALHAAVVHAGPLAFVTDAGYSGDVSVVDTATNAVVKTIQLRDNSPVAVAVDPTGARAYVATSGQVAVIDVASVLVPFVNAVVGTISAGPGFSPKCLAMSPDGTRLYVCSYGKVYVVDTATNAVIASIDASNGGSGYLRGVAVDAAGTRAYALLQGAQATAVQVIDLATQTVSSTIHFYDPGPVSSVVLSPDGSRLYVAAGVFNRGEVWIADTATGTPLGRISVGVGPSGMAIERQGRRLYTANAGVGTVSVVDLASGAVVATIPVGVNPADLALNPPGTRAYVANAGSGTASVIDLATNTVMTSIALPGTPAGMAIAATAPATPDVDGDGSADVVWRNAASGEVNWWRMNGTALLPGSGHVSTVSSPDWIILATGDFDGDGKADLLWRNTATGDVNVWFLDGTAVKPTSGSIAAINPARWQFAGTGDIDGDGNSDIVWRDATTGDVYVWFMNGLAMLPGSGPIGSVPSAWNIVGVGDVDGDGKADLVWHNVITGDVNVWLLDGDSIKSGSGSVANLNPAQWQFGGVGDVDGDRKADLVWRNIVTGDVHVWLMDGLAIRTGSGFVNTAPPATWSIVGMGDFDGDGRADLLWRSSTHAINTWLMSGRTIKPASGEIANVGTAQWQPVKP
ncbi:MAG: FG-GAP-like repeat-containing protein [Casimicrobiaceae bacterium]